MEDHGIKPTSVRLERPLYEALNGLSQAVDLPVGKLLRLAIIDYIGRLEIGRVRLSASGEAFAGTDAVGSVIKKYREATKSRKPADDPGPSDLLAARLQEIEARLCKLENRGRMTR